MSGSQPGKSAGVQSLRIGCADIVVNVDCRSGLFASVGCSVFFSQAISFADGFREEVDSAGAMVGVFVGCESLITNSNAMRKPSVGQEFRDGGFFSEVPKKKKTVPAFRRQPWEKNAKIYTHVPFE